MLSEIMVYCSKYMCVWTSSNIDPLVVFGYVNTNDSAAARKP